MKRNEYFTEAEIKEQKKRRKIGRRVMALLLAGMMLFSNIPSNVSAVSDNDISMLPDAMVQTEDTDTTADATEGKTVTVTGATEQLLQKTGMQERKANRLRWMRQRILKQTRQAVQIFLTIQRSHWIS